MTLEDIRSLSLAESELEARIESLAWKIGLLKSPLSSTSIPINGTTAEFCEDHWQPVIDKVNSHSLIDAYRLFWEGFQAQLDMRLQVSDLRDKADRLYVDTLLRNVEESVHQSVETAITNEYAEILLEIQQAHDMVGTMKEHFQESVNSFRSELTRFKKKLLEEVANNEPNAARRAVESAPAHLPPRSTLKLAKQDATVPHICKSPYRKRTRPLVPKKLGDCMAITMIGPMHLRPSIGP
jgi:hypothetical protein